MAAPHFSLLTEAKAAARKRALAARQGCDPKLGADLAAHVLAEWPIADGAAVAGFWPMAGEIDIRPLLTALHERGHPILLPVTPKVGQALTFRRWTPGCTMITEKFGTLRPDGPEGVPDVLFVPLLAFDRAGHRLGYGGGFYDRTLAGLPGRPAIGCAFTVQELDAVPTDEYDAPLSAVATERGLILF